jgi:N-acetylglutamate synthase-like GNAT family acetyltransferase
MAEVRWAREEDIGAVKRLADSNSAALGFVVRASLEAQMRRQELLISECQGKVVGFVSFHHRRDKWTTIYELCVEKNYRRQGIGRALIEAVQEDALRFHQSGIRLKCPLNLPANSFYARIGFTRVAIEEGKRRPLAIWEKLLNGMLRNCP